MFRLYYAHNSNEFKLIFKSDELRDCVSYLSSHNIICQRCIIISPNGRKIVFNDNNDLVFDHVA